MAIALQQLKAQVKSQQQRIPSLYGKVDFSKTPFRFAIRGAFIATFMNKYSGLPMALTGAPKSFLIVCS